MTDAWKAFERSVCRDLGYERRGPTGEDVSDCEEACPYSVEVKRTKRGAIETAYITQARRHGESEKKPWLLVVGPAGEPRNAVAVMQWAYLKRLLTSLPDQSGNRPVYPASNPGGAAGQHSRDASPVREVTLKFLHEVVEDMETGRRRLALALERINTMNEEINTWKQQIANLQGKPAKILFPKEKANS